MIYQTVEENGGQGAGFTVPERSLARWFGSAPLHPPRHKADCTEQSIPD